MKLFFAVILLIPLLLSTTFLQATMADSSYCVSKCAERCSRAGLKKRCLKYCGICCGQCNCVPSGTNGNKQECPCYAKMLNSKGKPKCP